MGKSETPGKSKQEVTGTRIALDEVWPGVRISTVKMDDKGLEIPGGAFETMVFFNWGDPNRPRSVKRYKTETEALDGHRITRKTWRIIGWAHYFKVLFIGIGIRVMKKVGLR